MSGVQVEVMDLSPKDAEVTPERAAQIEAMKADMEKFAEKVAERANADRAAMRASEVRMTLVSMLLAHAARRDGEFAELETGDIIRKARTLESYILDGRG